MLEVGRALIESLLKIGPVGTVAASVLVTAALIVIIYAQVSGIFADRRAEKQAGDFQARLLAAVKTLQDSETALRRENAELRTEVDRLHAGQELQREQLRRLIDVLHRVMTGRLAPAEIRPEDLQEGAA